MGSTRSGPACGRPPTMALDATYSLGRDLSGIGVYSREIMEGLAAAHPEARFTFCYRSHRFLRSFERPVPANCRRGLLHEPWGPRRASLFHGLNQRLPRMRLRRTVCTFHDLFVLTGEYSTPDFRQRFAEQARHAAAHADAVIADSEFTAGQVRELLGVERSRIFVVHLGTRALPFREAPRETIILHVGAVQRRKNLTRLVAAFEKVDPPWRLVLTGSRGFGADEILQRIETSPARERIVLPGYVADEALADLFSRAMVFAFPSLDEGFGMPVLESMAAGVPVLTSNRSALPEVAGEAALLVNPEDTEELTEALRLLTRDEGLRTDLAARGRARAARFTWENTVARTWDVYRTVLTTDPGGR